MNIIQQQELLKDLSDQDIAGEMQRPSGNVPLYLVAGEAKRRADLRERFKVWPTTNLYSSRRFTKQYHGLSNASNRYCSRNATATDAYGTTTTDGYGTTTTTDGYGTTTTTDASDSAYR